jgi:hypothetical protein
MFSTGATGLGLATSGVTGNFQDRDMNDDGRAIGHFMRFRFGVVSMPRG